MKHSLHFPGSDEPDYIKGLVIWLFGVVQGRPGDILVLICICVAALGFWRKKYKTAVGCIVLMCGIVLIRVAISILFGADFSRN